MALYLEFDLIVRRFEKRKLRYAVAGGLAVGLHGYIRATQDMDFLVHEEDIEKAESVLSKLGYRVNPTVQEFSRSGLALKRLFKRVPREDELMLVDILIPKSVRMKQVLHKAVSIPFGKGSIRIVSVGDLMYMKRLRGSKTDKADIEFLRKKR
jgi:putative nucleotidyltransferase-like protein